MFRIIHKESKTEFDFFTWEKYVVISMFHISRFSLSSENTFIFIIDVVVEWKEQRPTVRRPELSPLIICEKWGKQLFTISLTWLPHQTNAGMN